jgi:hypothetical protein
LSEERRGRRALEEDRKRAHKLCEEVHSWRRAHKLRGEAHLEKGYTSKEKGRTSKEEQAHKPKQEVNQGGAVIPRRAHTSRRVFVKLEICCC